MKRRNWGDSALDYSTTGKPTTSASAGQRPKSSFTTEDLWMAVEPTERRLPGPMVCGEAP